MANNRLYLRNKQSGECIFMGKSFGDGYYLCDYYNNWFDRINYFYERAYINNDVSGYIDSDANSFEIISEDDITMEDWHATLKMEEEYKKEHGGEE